MHEISVYDYLLRNNKVKGLLFSGGSEEEHPEIDWLDFPNEKREKPLIATDGSYKYSVRDFGLIYAVTGLALYQDKVAVRDIGLSLVDIMDKNLFRQKHLSDFLSMLMKLAEIKNLLRVLQRIKGDDHLILMDGSFISDVISPQPTYEWISHLGIEREDVLKFDDKIEQRVKDIRIVFWDWDFASFKIAENFMSESLPVRAYITVNLLYYEYLYSLELLTKLKNPIFFIAKDSFSSDFVREWGIKSFITDQVMFNMCTFNRSGYAPPIPAFLEEKKKHLPPQFVGILDVEIYQTFVRFKPLAASTYKVEILNVPREEIGFYLSYIADTSPQGYPFLLVNAHKGVVISERDMEKIGKIVSSPFRKSPRVYLNE